MLAPENAAVDAGVLSLFSVVSLAARRQAAKAGRPTRVGGCLIADEIDVFVTLHSYGALAKWPKHYG